MARTIAEIKQEIGDAYMNESAVREKYGFTASDTFEGKFSKVSIEGLLFYVVAFGIWVMEKLFDTHKEEVSTMLADLTPHTTRWYRNRVLGFVPSWASEDDPPVKYCSVDDRGARLKIKVASGEAGARTTVQAPSEHPERDASDAILTYLNNEKDAGIKIEVVNENSNRLKATLSVWYDPMELVPGDKPVEAALKAYVSNLDFDGLLTRNGIVDALREVAGVEIVNIELLQTKYAENAWRDFGNQERAESGYWSIEDADVKVTYYRYRKENL